MKMKTMKDQGNQFFKKDKYNDAIKCYDQYVKLDNKDNQKAYCNMAICYFKLKKYQQCINACEKAIQIDPKFQKAFFRYYQAAKKLNDLYGVLIAGQAFCKYSILQEDIQIVQRHLIECKQKISQPKLKNSSETDQILQQIMNKDLEILPKKSIMRIHQTCLDAKWQRISQKVQKNIREGTNQAWEFINNQCHYQSDKKKYRKVLSKTRYCIINEQEIPKNLYANNESSSDQYES